MDSETPFEDYTDMVEGTKTGDGGLIARCPRCGRLGRFTQTNGNDSYEHRRTGPDETSETCVIPPPEP